MGDTATQQATIVGNRKSREGGRYRSMMSPPPPFFSPSISPFICPRRTGCSARALQQKSGKDHKSGRVTSQNQTVMTIRMAQAGPLPGEMRNSSLRCKLLSPAPIHCNSRALLRLHIVHRFRSVTRHHLSHSVDL